ncbi:hypothetical protein OIU85_004113 [Salix viminalis]|uniref:Uncharacterized protein n=1 Tax=Salix viminalis TaxID=40686 RepID=A0A9Q0PS72_SALVM|nr:hypothetical protein OIU85_004113 [Salix viminalis]
MYLLSYIFFFGLGADSPNVHTGYLKRIMRFLVSKDIFTEHHPLDGGGTLYGLNEHSRWLLRDSNSSLASIVLMENIPLEPDPWHFFDQSGKEGGLAFMKAHG